MRLENSSNVSSPPDPLLVAVRLFPSLVQWRLLRIYKIHLYLSPLLILLLLLVIVIDEQIMMQLEIIYPDGG